MQRVLLAPHLDFLRRAVGAVVVVRRVSEVAVRLALDEGGSLALPCVADGGVHGGVHVERVVAVDDHPRHSVGVRVLGDVLDRRLLGEGHGDGVAVVLADEDDREAVDAREVQGLVEVTLRRGAVAEVADGHAVVAPEVGGEADAGRVGDVGCDGRRPGDDAESPAPPVAGHLPPA